MESVNRRIIELISVRMIFHPVFYTHARLTDNTKDRNLSYFYTLIELW
jgi:hypothetical protein